MKVVHLNTLDTGGAATAAYRIHKGMQAVGMDSTLLVLNKTLPDASIKSLELSSSRASLLLNRYFERCNRLAQGYPKRPKGLELFSDTFSEVVLKDNDDIRRADIVHLHWVAGLMNYVDWPHTLQGKPVVWTLHDMNPFTGGCHYAGTCKKYSTACGACPQLGSAITNDLSFQAFGKKAEAYEKLDLTLVAPSQWLARCIRESRLLAKFPLKVVPYGLPLDIYSCRPAHQIHQKFGIPRNDRIVLFGADAIDNPRKGLRHLFNALRLLASQGMDCENLTLLVFGQNSKYIRSDLPFKMILTGRIQDPVLLSEIYSASDVFVIPSLEDNLPNTAIEAMACGTPVVGFDTGGIADIVEHYQTGYLAAVGNDAQLAEGIHWVLSQSKKGPLFREKCRKKVEKQFSIEVQADAYERIYRANCLDSKVHPTRVRSNWQSTTQRSHADFGNPLSYNAEGLNCHQKSGILVGSAIRGGLNPKNLPKISVVTPSLNQAGYLEKCIDSILCQRYPNLEYIVMDGGSTDGSVQIIKKYEKHMTFWQSRPDGGHYAAVQEGFERSSGDIMTWINADDIFDPKAFCIAAAIFLQCADMEWITGRPSSINADATQFSTAETLPVWSRQKYLDKKYHLPFIQQEGTFWRRSLWNKAGGKLKTQLALAGDLELWTRFFRHAPLYSVDYGFASYRTHGDNRASRFKEQYFREANEVIAQELDLLHKGKYPKIIPAPEPISKRQIAQYLYMSGLEESGRKARGSQQGNKPKLSVKLTQIRDARFDREEPPVSKKVDQNERIQISIILPTKDRAEGLEDVLKSLPAAMQDIQYEILLYTGRPNGPIGELAQKYNITKIYLDSEVFGSQEGFAWSKLMNHAFAHAAGTWLMYASDDIVFYPNCFSHALSLAEEMPNASIGGIAFLHRNTVETHGGVFQHFGYDSLNGDKLFINFGLIHAEAFKKTNGFDEELRFYWADVDICMQLWRSGYRIVASLKSLVDHKNFLEQGQKEQRDNLFDLDTTCFSNKWSGSPLFANKNALEKVRFFLSDGDSQRIIASFRPTEHGGGLHPAKRIQIVIDGVIFQLQANRPQGISRVWRNLIPALLQHMPKAEITILQRKGYGIPVSDVNSITVPAFRLGSEGILDEDDWMLGRICRELKADLFISTYYTRAPGVANVVMVHDLIPELLGYDLSQPEWLAKQRVIETGDAFICVSEATCGDLKKCYPQISRRPLRVAHNGLEDGFRPADKAAVQQFRHKHQIEKPYLLMVGNRHGYKNAVPFLKSLACVPISSRYTVVCVGGERRLSREESALKQQLDIRFIGQLEDLALAAAYSGAEALLSSSKNEGFGLPAIEAMACGCPVIAEYSAAIAEICADAACYATHTDHESIYGALQKVADPSLRQTIVQQAMRRADRYDWKKSAAEIEELLATLVSRPAVLLTAIVSTYNAAHYLRGCLDDLGQQTMASRMEIIVVDSASEQDEGAIVRDFQHRHANLKYIRTSQREGVYSAWNRGIKFALGQYITNANTDDRHRRDAFERMTAVLDSAPQIALVYADVIKTATENQTFLNCTPTGMLSWYDWQRERLLDRGCFIGPQPVWRRQMHEIYGYFDESLTIAADYEFWLRISQSHDFQRISQPLGLYLEREDSVGHADRRRKQAEEQAIIDKYSQALAHGEMICFLPFARLRRALAAGDSSALRQAMQEIAGIAHNGALAQDPLPIEHACRDFSALAAQGTISSQQIEAFLQQIGFCFLTRGNCAASVAAQTDQPTLPLIPSDSAPAKAASNLPRQGGPTMQFYEKVQNGVHCLFDGGHIEVAQWVLEKLLTEEPGNALAHHECAVLAHRQGDAHHAAVHFERAAQLAPDNVAFQKSLGDFYHVVQGNIEKAVAQYRKALDLQPDDLGTVLTVAHLCVALHRFDEARGYYQRVLDIDPMHAEARRIMDQLIQQQREQNQRQPSADELYASAKQFLGQSDSAQAMQTLERLLTMSPTHALAHNDMGVLYYESGAKEKALAHYEKAAELAPENSVFLKNLADFYFLEMGDAQKALTRYVQALTINPLDVESLINTGHICTALNLPEDARVFFNRVLEIEPWHMEAFKSLDQIDRPVCCDQAPAAAGDLYEQAQAAASAGDISGAVKLMQQLIGRQPQHAMAFNDLGVLFYDQGDKANALRHYEQAARLSPENATILKNLADFYYIEQGRTQEALQIYVRLLEANREDLDCLMAAAKICTDLGNQEDAGIFYARVLEIAPENLQAREALNQFSAQSENNRASARFSANQRMAF